MGSKSSTAIDGSVAGKRSGFEYRWGAFGGLIEAGDCMHCLLQALFSLYNRRCLAVFGQRAAAFNFGKFLS